MNNDLINAAILAINVKEARTLRVVSGGQSVAIYRTAIGAYNVNGEIFFDITAAATRFIELSA